MCTQIGQCMKIINIHGTFIVIYELQNRTFLIILTNVTIFSYMLY